MSKIFNIGYLNTAVWGRHGEHVASRIKPSGARTEVRPFSNYGALQKAVQETSIDLMVIAADQLPEELPEELELIAFTQRQTVNDVVISLKKINGLKGEEMKVGVSSALRLAFVRHYYPEVEPFLGPGPEALVEQLTRGELDALVLSYTEALYLDSAEHILEQLETSYFVPCAGQGSSAVVCHKKADFHKKEILQLWVNHEETEDCIRAERSFIKALHNTGMENMLPFSYAHYEGTLTTLKAGVISKDGKNILKAKRSAALGESKDLGKKVAAETVRLISEQHVHAI